MESEGDPACECDGVSLIQSRFAEPVNGKVDLSGLSLREIPSSFTGTQNITKLCAADNKLTEFPIELCLNLKQLKWLDLRSNNICRIPKDIIHLDKLETLLLDDNQITHLPTELGYLKRIKSVFVKNNPIEFPPSNIVSGGTQKILHFLRNIENTANQPGSNENSVSLEMKPMELTNRKVDAINYVPTVKARTELADVNAAISGVESTLHDTADYKFTEPNSPKSRTISDDFQTLQITNLEKTDYRTHIPDKFNDCSIWKSKLYRKIERRYVRKSQIKDKNEVHALKKFITQSARHEALIPEDPPQPTMERIKAIHQRERRKKYIQHSKFLQQKAVQKLKDVDKLQNWKDEYRWLKEKANRLQMNKTDMEIKLEAESRITCAPFDIEKEKLKLIDSEELKEFRISGIKPEPRPKNMDPLSILGLELGSMERDKRLLERVTTHLDKVLQRSEQAIPLEKEALREELIAAKNDLDSAIQLHHQVTRRLETLQHFHGSNRRDLW